MNDKAYIEKLIDLMESNSGDKEANDLADKEAHKRGYLDWIDAYRALVPCLGSE
jgi:hypothetical protein